MKHCQVEVQEKYFWISFSTIGKLAYKYFQYHWEVIYSIEQYILTKKFVFPHKRNFALIYGPLSCLINVFLALFLWFCLPFFKSLFNFRAHALQLELHKVVFTNFVKFLLQSMSSKIEQAFEKRTKFVFFNLHFNSNFNFKLNVIFSALSH